MRLVQPRSLSRGQLRADRRVACACMYVSPGLRWSSAPVRCLRRCQPVPFYPRLVAVEVEVEVVVAVGQAVGVVLLPSARLAGSGRMGARRSAGGSDF